MTTWKQRIDEARQRGHFTSEDIRLASDWHTCAVGENCNYDLNEAFHMIHNHRKLNRLGMNFASVVKFGSRPNSESPKEIDIAEDIYNEITAFIQAMNKAREQEIVPEETQVKEKV